MEEEKHMVNVQSETGTGPAAQEQPERKQTVDVMGLSEEAVRAVESFISALRRQAASTPAVSPDEWAKLFDTWMREVAARAGQYPPGFVVDDSRETIYEGRGE
jgi:hypothetical protein